MMWNVIAKIITGVGIGAGIIVAANGTRILNKIDKSGNGDTSRPVPVPPGLGSDPDLGDVSSGGAGDNVTPASLDDAKNGV